MIKLDDNLLQELGLSSLQPDDKKKMLAHIYETLEMRVGMELAKQMTDAQLAEFEEFITRNDEAGALRWLETNFPNYKDVVAAEFEKLKGEIKQVAPQIIASSQQQPAMPQAQPMQQQPYAAPQPQYTPQPGQQQPYAVPQQLQYQGAPAVAPQPQQPYYQQAPQQPQYPPQYQQQGPAAPQQPQMPPQQPAGGFNPPQPPQGY